MGKFGKLVSEWRDCDLNDLFENLTGTLFKLLWEISLALREE
jgi:hypothetical protein